MQKNLTDLKIQINVCVHELHELGQDIKNFDNMVTDTDSHSYSEEELKDQMKELIDDYTKKIDKARILLECYFAEESKAGEPTDFLLRRLYAKLKTAI